MFDQSFNCQETTALIHVQNLCKTFDGRTMVLDDVCLDVAAGSVYGLIGENGAGKTTLIRHLIGRTSPTSGEVRMFDMDPIAQPAEVLGKIGYLSEPGDMPQWMRVGELIDYMSAFYTTWDAGFAKSMQDAFQLANSTHISDLSRGEAARLGLLLAVAHRPPLLILDEPSSGLDPVVRNDILSEIIRSVADEGRTVFFSSHLLDEIEQIADRVGIMNHGRLIVDAPVNELLSGHELLQVEIDERETAWRLNEHTVCQHRENNTWHVLCDRVNAETVRQALRVRGNGREVAASSPSLNEMFAFIVKCGQQPASVGMDENDDANESGSDST